MSEKKTTIVNIYNFIRMSHQEPSEFLEAAEAVRTAFHFRAQI